MTLIPLLALIALGCAVVAATGRAPLWVATVLLCIVLLMQVWAR